MNAFDLKAALLARHAQHPVIIHFPIALFIASVLFELLVLWRKNPVFASVAYYNLVGAAMSLPFAIATGLGAWRWQLEGAAFKGNLRLHLIFALTSASLIFILCWIRSRLRARGISPGAAYVAVTLLALMVITLTGHLGGILSGVETP
jgi:uncharacterized membrane protein